MSSVGRSSARCAGGGSGAREVWQSTCADQETELSLVTLAASLGACVAI